MASRPEHLPGDLHRRDRRAGADPGRAEPDQQPGPEPTVLVTPLADRLALFAGLPALAVVAALVLPPLARWALGLGTGLPMRPVFWALGAIERPWQVAAAAAVAVVLGLGGAAAISQRWTTVTVAGTGLRFDADGRNRTVPRADVAAVFLDGGQLVALDRDSRQLVRETLPATGDSAARALRAHGYPWREADPYGELYRRWVQGAPDLPGEVDAVLAAREAALRKKAVQEARELRVAAQNLGYAVRDEGTRQFWRPLVRS